MYFTYRIGLFGSISSGKTTLNNSIFCKLYSPMNIAKSTILPQVYSIDFENNKFDSDQEILKRNYELNREDLWDGKTFVKYDCKPPADFFKSDKFLNYEIYDLFGLNDPSNKEIYINWIKENFDIFDCIILVVNINNASYTLDEIEIYRTIFGELSKRKQVNILILANKCDKMIIGKNNLICDSDKENIFNEQIKPFFTNLADEFNIDKIRLYFMKISAKNAYIYRTIFNNKPEEILNHLDEIHIMDAMDFEMGMDKLLDMDEIERNRKIKEVINKIRCDQERYERNMKRTGFENLRNFMNNLVKIPSFIYGFYEKEITILVNKKFYHHLFMEIIQHIEQLSFSDENKSKLMNIVCDKHYQYYFENYFTPMKILDENIEIQWDNMDDWKLENQVIYYSNKLEKVKLDNESKMFYFSENYEFIQNDIKYFTFVKSNNFINLYLVFAKNKSSFLKNTFTKLIIEEIGEENTKKLCTFNNNWIHYYEIFLFSNEEDCVVFMDKMIYLQNMMDDEKFNKKEEIEILDEKTNKENMEKRFSMEVENKNIFLYNLRKSIMELSNIEIFEKETNKFAFLNKTNYSKLFFKNIVELFIQNMHYIDDEQIFKQFVDIDIYHNLDKYGLLEYNLKIFEKKICIENWGNINLFEWIFLHKNSNFLESKKKLIVSKINAEITDSDESVFYLSKIIKQLPKEMEDVKIYCEYKYEFLRQNTGFKEISYENIIKFNKFDGLFGDFLQFLISFSYKN